MIGPTAAVKSWWRRTGGLPQGRGGIGCTCARDDGRRSVQRRGAYVFHTKRTDRIKLIFWDGTGVCLVAKRLENDEFRWPKVQDGVVRLTAAQLSALLEGLD